MGFALNWRIRKKQVMKTISKCILYPFISMIVLLPLAILLFFNLGMTFYVNTQTEKELRNTIQTMSSLIEAQEASEDASGELKAVISDLSAGLTATKLNVNTDFFLVNQEGEIVYPRTETIPQSAEVITEKGLNTILEHGMGKIQRINLHGKTYFCAGIVLKKYVELENITVVFISSTDSFKSISKSLNLILILVLVVTVSVSILAALSVAKRISRPIVRACDYARQIGKGEFIEVPIEKNTKEIYEFCTSLNQMSKKLEAYDKAQKQFLQNASHELRTPLMSIQGYAEGIEKNVLKDYKMAAGIICSESIRLNELVGELLTLSRIENQTYAVEVERQNISHLILDNVQRIHGFALKEKIEIVLDLDESIEGIVEENLFSQAVTNMISNGIRYAKKSIKITLWKEEDQIKIKIADDGKGFSEEDLPHLFERFYKGRQGNFGLGLAIAKSAIEYMGGRVEAYNEKGAVFLITFISKKV